MRDFLRLALLLPLLLAACAMPHSGQGDWMSGASQSSQRENSGETPMVLEDVGGSAPSQGTTH